MVFQVKSLAGSRREYLFKYQVVVSLDGTIRLSLLNSLSKKSFTTTVGLPYRDTYTSYEGCFKALAVAQNLMGKLTC